MDGTPVRFRDCTCPGSPHDGRDGADDGDIVVMRSTLGFGPGAECSRLFQEAALLGDWQKYATELVGPVYVREGPLGWNVVNEDGPVPCTKEALSALSYADAYEIVEVADDLYTNAVIAPLLERTNAPSGNGQNGVPTRQTRRSSTKARSPRKSSSRNGSAGHPSPVSP